MSRKVLRYLKQGYLSIALMMFIFSSFYLPSSSFADEPPTFVGTWGNEGVLNGVSDIAIDANNNVYVAESFYSRVTKFSPTGEVLKQWGGAGQEDGVFLNWGDYGIGLGLDAGGNVYVADYARVQKFSSEGEQLDILSTDNTKALSFSSSVMPDWSSLADVAVDATGNMYVVDYSKHRIRKFAANGTWVENWGATDAGGQPINGTGNKEFYSPSRIAVAGNFVYISDTGNKRIQKFSLDGTYQTQWGIYFTNGTAAGPGGIAVGTDGKVYVVDSSGTIQRFTAEGVYENRWGSGGVNSRAVAVDSAGTTYGYGSLSSLPRILRFDTAGVRQATGFGYGGNEDGKLSQPTDIAEDNAGNIYVADTGNNRVQKFSKNAQNQWEFQGKVSVPSPYGVAFDPVENALYVLARNAPTSVKKFTWDTSTPVLQAEWGAYGTSDGQLASSAGIEVAGDFVYIADNHGYSPFPPSKIQVFDKYGNLLAKQTIASGTAHITGIAVDATPLDASLAHIYVSVNHQVWKYIFNVDATGNYSFTPAGAPLLTFVGAAQGLAVDKEHNLYITKVSGGVESGVLKVSSIGEVISSWGKTGGNSNKGEFASSGNSGVYVAANGDIYVADNGSYRVQVFAYPPAPPSGLSAVLNADYINLTWVDNSNSETAFDIERCSGEGCESFSKLAEVPKDSTTFDDSDLQPDTVYRYRVRAVHSGLLFSAYSDPVTVLPLPAPSSLIGNAPGSTRISLTWQDNSNGETGFELELFCGAGDGMCFTKIADVTAGVTNYNHISLQPAQTYQYRVRAVRGSDSSKYSDLVSVTTPPLPLAPSSLSVGVDGSTKLNVSWMDNSSDETGFELERCAGSSCSFSKIVSLGAGVKSYVNTGLQANGTYSYRVRAVRGEDASAYSNVVSKATLPLPLAPTTLTATVLGSSSIKLTWADKSSDETGFEVWRCLGATCTVFSKVVTLGLNSTSYTNTGLSVNSSYRYKVRAVRGVDVSTESNLVTAKTLALPVAPTTLTATVLGISSIKLTWADKSSDETGFEVWRCLGATCTVFSKVVTLGLNSTSYTNTGLSVNSSYRYKVRAVRGVDVSTESNLVTAKTLALPVAPTTLTATVLGSSSIKLTWADKSSDETGFEVWRCLGATCTVFTKIVTLSVNSTSYINTGLGANSSYRYKVRAVRGVDVSADSNIVAPKTLALLAAPSSLTATVLGSTSIKLTWADKSSDETGFEVWRCLGATCTTFTKIATLNVNTLTYTNNRDLTANSSYRYKVRAVRGVDISAESNVVTAKTLALLAAPSSLTATVLGSSSIKLTWADKSSDETGFEVWRCLGATCTVFSKVVTLGLNSTSYTNTGLSVNSSYRYKVRAVRGMDVSTESNIVTAKTL